VNEAELITLCAAWARSSIPMDKSAGFDLLVLHRGEVYIVEVKQEGKYRMTDAERYRACQVELAGVPYSIIQTADDALKMLGLR